jgi:hypothetical protein
LKYWLTWRHQQGTCFFTFLSHRSIPIYPYCYGLATTWCGVDCRWMDFGNFTSSATDGESRLTGRHFSLWTQFCTISPCMKTVLHNLTMYEHCSAQSHHVWTLSCTISQFMDHSAISHTVTTLFRTISHVPALAVTFSPVSCIAIRCTNFLVTRYSDAKLDLLLWWKNSIREWLRKR